METNIRLKKKRAAQIVQSFTTEGYSLVTQSNACQECILRHKSNGNRLVVRVGSLGVYVFKNDRLIKLELV